MSRLVRALALLVWLPIWLPGGSCHAASGETSLIKAAYLYNMAKFTRWPDSGSATLTLCVAGSDDLANALESLRGKPVKGRQLLPMQINGDTPPGYCDLLYVANSRRDSHHALLDATRGRPLLTVADFPGFARAGGMIELFRDGDRLRFRINLSAARTAGLDIAPRLLELAASVE